MLLIGAPAYAQAPKGPPAASTTTPAGPAPLAGPAGSSETGTAGAAPSEAAAGQPAVIVDQSFALGVGDVVEVGVVGQPASRARVGNDGEIVLPLLGKVKALNLTANELAQKIQDALVKGGFYANPVVRVEVVGVSSRFATVLGNVASPGLLPLDKTYHLSAVVARVGAHAGESGFVILTRADGSSKKYSMEELATGGGAEDPVVMPGDKIYVPAATAEVFYVSGQVKAPGAFPIQKDMTVREAIARSGGLTEMGSEKKVKIFRKNVQLKGAKLDTKLEAGDIVEVGERLF